LYGNGCKSSVLIKRCVLTVVLMQRIPVRVIAARAVIGMVVLPLRIMLRPTTLLTDENSFNMFPEVYMGALCAINAVR